jgi:hypothetical protein
MVPCGVSIVAALAQVAEHSASIVKENGGMHSSNKPDNVLPLFSHKRQVFISSVLFSQSFVEIRIAEVEK